jgi:hypothetical protein
VGNESVVINTGPLIALTHGGVIAHLADLPFVFMSTTEVLAELESGNTAGKLVVPTDAVQIHEAEGREELYDALTEVLDAGEASVIHLALCRGIGRVCIDEREGRQVAREQGLKVMGTLGLLTRMKSNRLIAEIKPVLLRVVASGYYISDELIARTLQDAGEPFNP